jgi:hypothetical protein
VRVAGGGRQLLSEEPLPRGQKTTLDAPGAYGTETTPHPPVSLLAFVLSRSVRFAHGRVPRQAGVDTERPDNIGRTPLDGARSRVHEHIARYLSELAAYGRPWTRSLPACPPLTRRRLCALGVPHSKSVLCGASCKGCVAAQSVRPLLTVLGPGSARGGRRSAAGAFPSV